MSSLWLAFTLVGAFLAIFMVGVLVAMVGFFRYKRWI